MMQQHARQMQEQELRRSQERQSRPTERKTIVPIRSSMSEQREREVKQERHESQREEIKTVSSSSTRSRKQTMEKEKEKEKEKGKEINIPVKNYRSQSVRAREPSPPVDYPDVSDDTDENDVRLPDMDNNKKARKKSIQSYSKRTSVTRQYPGCVLS